MATTIADLLIKLSVQTAELTTGLKNAEDAIGSFVGGAKKLLGGLTLGIAVKKLASEMMSIYDAASEVSKVGQKVGMSATQIGQLSAAAEHVGVSMETMSRGLRFLSRSMVQAQDGNQKTALTFKELGIAIEESPGKLKNPQAVFLQLADAFSRSTDEARKTAIAMKLLGRGGAEMIPFLDEGSTTMQEWIAHAEKMGSVMSSGLASQSRSFKFTLIEIKDAIDGMKVALAEALLPHLQRAALLILDVAEALNGMKKYATTAATLLRDLTIALTALVYVKVVDFITKLIGSLGGLTGAFMALKNPVVIAVAVLSAVAIATAHYVDEVSRANREMETWNRTIKRMSLSDLDAEAEKLRNSIEDLTEDLVKLKKEQEDALASATGDDAGQIIAMNNLIKQKQAQLDLINRKLKAVTLKQEDVQMKISLDPTTDPGALKSLQDKLTDLKAEMIAFKDPVKGQVEAFNAMIQKIKEAVQWTDALDKAEKAARAQFMLNMNTMNAYKVTLAQRAGDLKQEVAYYDEYISDLESAYSLGIVDLDSYYAQREVIIRARAKAEIDALRESLNDPSLTPEKKIEINAEINVKTTGLDKDIKKEITDTAKAINDAAASVREGAFQSLVDENSIELELLTQQYAKGLLDIRAFYSTQRAIIQQESQAKISNIDALQALTPPGTKAWEDYENQKSQIRSKGVMDRIKMDNDESASNSKLITDNINTAAMLATVRAEGSASGYEAMRLQGEAQLILLQDRELQEIAQLNATLGQKTEAEMSFNEKRQAMEDLYAAQDRRRKQMTADIETSIDRQRLTTYSGVAGQLGDIFGKIYELGGKKMKVFYYMQKAMAIAQIMMNAAVAAMSALMPPPVGLGPIGGQGLAAAVWAIAAANVAIVVAQTMKGMAKGGPVVEGSGTKDDVPVRLMRGEYVQTKEAVRYYGLDVMEAIRRKSIPREVFQANPASVYSRVASPAVAYGVLPGIVTVIDKKLVSDTVTVNTFKNVFSLLAEKESSIITSMMDHEAYRRRTDEMRIGYISESIMRLVSSTVSDIKMETSRQESSTIDAIRNIVLRKEVSSSNVDSSVIESIRNIVFNEDPYTRENHRSSIELIKGIVEDKSITLNRYENSVVDSIKRVFLSTEWSTTRRELYALDTLRREIVDSTVSVKKNESSLWESIRRMITRNERTHSDIHTSKGFFAGGQIQEGSGVKDDVLIRVMRGEYIIPKQAVAHYGINAMEALRRMVIPKGVFAPMPAFAPAYPAGKYATGGVVSQGVANQVTVPVTVYGGDKALGSRLRENIEEVVVKTLREYSR